LGFDLSRALFIGFAISSREFDDLLEHDHGMPHQTQRFGWLVVEALAAGGFEVALISAVPALDYPRNDRVWYPRGKFVDRGVSGSTVAFCNVTGIKHLTRFVSARSTGKRQCKGAEPPDIIFVHGAHSPFLWSSIRLGRRYGIPVVPILTDLPGQRTRFDTLVSRTLKRIDGRLISAGLKKVDGVIVLTDRLAQDLAPGVPYLRMEGIAKPLASDAPGPVYPPHGHRTVVYAGGLRREYGVGSLLEAVSRSEGDWNLRIYGHGPLMEEVTAAAASNPRIFYGGLADEAELARAYADADLLVNPRPTSEDFTLYSFPSKLLEYLATGRPAMSTRIQGVPGEFEPYLYWTDSDVDSLAASIDRICAQSDEALATKGAQGRDFALSTRGVTAQGRRIREFISVLEPSASVHR